MHTQYVLQTLAEGFSSAATGQALFRSLAESLAKALAIDYVFVGECNPAVAVPGDASVPPADRLTVFYAPGREAEETGCRLAGSLLELLAGNQLRTVPAGVQKLFPNHPFLKPLGVDSYAGVPLLDAAGAVTGVLCVMHQGPLPKVATVEAVLRIAATRAEGELLRVRQERQLREAQEEVQRTKAVLARQVAAYREADHQRRQVEEILMQAPVGIAIYRGPGHVVELANPAICEIWDSRPEQVLGKPLFEALPQALGQGFEERLGGVLATGTPLEGNEVPVQITRDGKREQAFLKFAHQPLRDTQGTVTHVITIAQEVTQHVLGRQKTEASEARVQRLLDSMPQIAWTADREGNNTYVSEKWYEFTGVRMGPSYYETMTQLMHPEDLARTVQETLHSLSTGTPFQVNYRLRRRDGQYRWMLSRALPLPNEAGEITEWVGTLTDVHEQKAALDFLYTVLGGMPQIAWTSPPGATINYFNKRWYDYTGLTEAQSLEMGWQQALHPDDLPLAVERRTDGRRNGEPYEVENRYRRADGTYRWHLARVAPIRDDAGDITLWVGTATDIHDHKTGQHRLENTLRELHEKNFELDQFVYKTSHDLRSPLSTILGLVDILRQESDEATRRQYVDLIANRVHKLDRFIRSMLDYSRNTRTATGSQEIDLAVLVQECLADLEYMKHFGRLRLTLRVGEGRFCSDVFRLRIIFSNLISNAIKYQDFNKPESNLDITVEVTPAQAVIRCADNGVGIDPAYQAKVFDMFFRAAEQSDGSGLGLYIVKQAVAVLHGTIGMQSQVGTGTQFTITLPNTA
ncbi:MAG: PAS domain-containing protein [Cytophagales bacterium]|nr:PAS domain-containing protein [Cytophagales bacterium]